jgi:hypothetical protein
MSISGRLGLEGVGDGEDKLVTVDVNPTPRPMHRLSTQSRWVAATKRTTRA